MPLLHLAMSLVLVLHVAGDALGQADRHPTPPAVAPPAATPPTAPAAPAASQPAASARPALAAAPEIEKQTLQRMLQDSSWVRRAIAAIRLERYGCAASQQALAKLLDDPAWQVRAFALRSLARRRVPAQENWLAAEEQPRVLRAALRYRYRVDPIRLQNGVRALARSNELNDKMLAAELGAASGDAELMKLALEATKQVILKMDRIESGAFSPRLAAITGQPAKRRPYQWQQWLMRAGRSVAIQPAYAIESGDAPLEPSLLARLDADQFAGLESYMAALGERELDLAICLDCTASMSGEIAAAQGGIDDMMLFVGDVVASLRVGLVGYRDHGDEFETKAWDFNADIKAVRRQLWQLSAQGGGDEPEYVYQAMKLACTQLTWRPESTKVLVIVGDAPPHVGYGGQCVNIAQGAREESKLTTHTIQAKGKEVKHFAEIAKAGGGRCLSLKESDSLMAEVTGLTLGDRYEDEFREFFRVYLELCR